MSDQTVTLTLIRDEGLVLFELIADYNYEPELKLPNQYERIAINLLVGAFEKTLVEPFQRDYLEQVNAARNRLTERYGGSE
jgi:hypothetical protein